MLVLKRCSCRRRPADEEGSTMSAQSDSLLSPLVPTKAESEHKEICQRSWITGSGRQRSHILLPPLYKGGTSFMVPGTAELGKHSCQAWVICLKDPGLADRQRFTAVCWRQSQAHHAAMHCTYHRLARDQARSPTDPGPAPRKGSKSGLLAAGGADEFAFRKTTTPERLDRLPGIRYTPATLTMILQTLAGQS